MNNLLEAYRKLNKLYEAKADQEAFVNKFGKDYFDLFNKFKGRLKSKNISTDMTWHVKHTNVEDMKELLDNFNNQVVTDDKGKSKLNRKKIFEDNTFVVWEILDWETAMNMADGASWCIAGRYQTKEPKPSQAKQYFNEYLKSTYSNYYYVIAKNTGRKWCICKRPNRSAFGGKDTIDIWSQEDRAIASRSEGSGIEGLPTIEEIGYYVDDYKTFKSTSTEKVDDPYLALAMEYLDSDNVSVVFEDTVYANMNGSGSCRVEDIETGRNVWKNYYTANITEEHLLNDFGSSNLYLDCENFKEDIENYIERELEKYSWEDLKLICTDGNYSALSDLKVCEIVRMAIIDYTWPDEIRQDFIKDDDSNMLEDFQDHIKQDAMIICDDAVEEGEQSWLSIAIRVIEDVDYISNVIDHLYNLYIYLNSYFNDNVNECIASVYGYDFLISQDGQLFAYPY